MRKLNKNEIKKWDSEYLKNRLLYLDEEETSKALPFKVYKKTLKIIEKNKDMIKNELEWREAHFKKAKKNSWRTRVELPAINIRDYKDSSYDRQQMGLFKHMAYVNKKTQASFLAELMSDYYKKSKKSNKKKMDDFLERG